MDLFKIFNIDHIIDIYNYSIDNKYWGMKLLGIVGNGNDNNIKNINIDKLVSYIKYVNCKIPPIINADQRQFPKELMQEIVKTCFSEFEDNANIDHILKNIFKLPSFIFKQFELKKIVHDICKYDVGKIFSELNKFLNEHTIVNQDEIA